MLRAFVISAVVLSMMSFLTEAVAQQDGNKVDTFLSKENIGLVNMFESLRQKLYDSRLSASSEEALQLKKTYRDINLSWIADKGEVMFAGNIQGESHAVAADVYIYTQKGICQSKVLKVYENHDDTGGGGVGSRAYTVNLQNDSLCRGQSALISFHPQASTFAKMLYTHQKIDGSEEKNTLNKLRNKFANLDKLKLNLSKVANPTGAAFYIVECIIPHMFVNNRYKLIFRINENELDLLYVGSIGVVRSDYKSSYWQIERRDDEYYSGDGWSKESVSNVMADLNQNGLPEAIYSTNNCCDAQTMVMELKSQIEANYTDGFGN